MFIRLKLESLVEFGGVAPTEQLTISAASQLCEAYRSLCCVGQQKQLAADSRGSNEVAQRCRSEAGGRQLIAPQIHPKFGRHNLARNRCIEISPGILARSQEYLKEIVCRISGSSAYLAQ